VGVRGQGVAVDDLPSRRSISFLFDSGRVAYSSSRAAAGNHAVHDAVYQAE